jgi:uroporphyrinogen decarboxylase
MDKIFLDTLKGNETERPPVWFMRQAGRYMDSYRNLRKDHSMKEICHNPELASQLAYNSARELGVDAAINFSDIMIPLENLGYRIDFVEGVGPVTEMLDSPLENFTSPSADAVSAYKKKYTDIPLIGFIGGPFTVASYVIGHGPDKDLAKTKHLMFTEEEIFNELIKKISLILRYDAMAQIKAGADVIQIFDSWVGSLDPTYCEEILTKTVKGLVSEIHSVNKSVIYFSVGSSGMIDSLKKSSADFLSLDWRCSMKKVRDENQKLGIQGNLDPSIVASSPHRSYKSSAEILKEMKNENKFIFNLGHGVLPSTNIDTLKKIVSIVKGDNYE